MKKILLSFTLSLLFTPYSMAGFIVKPGKNLKNILVQASADWSELEENNFVDWPKVNFAGSKFWVPVSNVCFTQDAETNEVSLHAGYKVACSRYGGYDADVCQDTITYFLVKKGKDKTVCTKWGGPGTSNRCLEEVTFFDAIKLNYSVAVYSQDPTAAPSDNQEALFYKNYQVPACN